VGGCKKNQPVTTSTRTPEDSGDSVVSTKKSSIKGGVRGEGGPSPGAIRGGVYLGRYEKGPDQEKEFWELGQKG